LKRRIIGVFKTAMALLLIVSSGLAIYSRSLGKGFDPVREVQSLRNENRRDDALDMTRFFIESGDGDTEKLRDLEKELEYTLPEKVKSFLWDGVIKGEVYDSISGLGAIASDLCVFGDVRDLSIQGWRYLWGDPSFDKLIMILSATGIGLSSSELVNGCNALAKNALKFIKGVPKVMEKGLLKKVLKMDIGKEASEKVFTLLKKTNGLFPGPFHACRTSMTSSTSTPR
jgi:hypothetical protein